MSYKRLVYQEVAAQGNSLDPLLTNKQEYAYQWLKSSIIENKIKPSTLQVERHLSEMLHISRTPVRTALMRLADEGFVVISPGRGMVVAPLYKHDVVDVYTLRKALDVLAIELYIGRATKASIQQMADAFDAMEEAYHLEDYAEVAQQDEVFHGIYIHNTGNGRLEAMLDGLKDQSNRMRHLVQEDHTRIMASRREHQAILEAVEAKDVEKACEAVQQHMISTMEYHLQKLKNDESAT